MNIKSHIDKALEYRAQANITQACYHFRAILKEHPHHALSLSFLAENDNSIDIQDLEKALSKNTDLHDKVRLCFSIGKCHEKAKNYDSAFLAYQNGNDIVHTLQPYKKEKLFEVLKEIFPTDRDLPKAVTKPHSITPIFIVGLPRSGTTLLESMLGMHSEIEAAGELKSLAPLIGTLGQYKDPSAFNTDIMEKKAQSYLKDHKSSFINKMPYNFFSIPFIKIMFPNALIIHIRRNVQDNLLSCYTTLFDDGNLWTYNLDDLRNYYLLYQDLMAHWKTITSFTEIDYESLVQSPEAVLRHLLENNGFAWEEACLDFHSDKRAIKTASALQVRQPLNNKSIGRAERFSQHLTCFEDL